MEFGPNGPFRVTADPGVFRVYALVSILGPLLFTVMVNDLPSVATNSKIMMYADDTVLFYSAKKVDELESSLNEDLCHVNSWVNTNGLSLNPIKTQFMIFGTPQKLSSITKPMCLKLENHTLTQVSTYKYLGVHLDPSLKWKDHIYHTSKKIGSRLALLSRLKRTLPLQSLKLLANSLVLPLFDYCSVAWSQCPNITKEILIKQHKRMAKIVLGVDTRTPTDQVLNQLNWTKLEQRWKLHRCKLVYRALRGEAPEYIALLFQKSNNVHNATRTAVSNGLVVPRARTSILQESRLREQALSHTGSLEWNELPGNVRNATSKHAFIPGGGGGALPY